MENVKPYIMKLKPAYKDYIWGGRRLIDEYKMDCPLERLSEAWVFSAHPDGSSLVENGALKGMTLGDAAKLASGSMGKNSEKFKYFPVLIKLIDAKRDLSVQVHPDDTYAAEHENSFGKTEVWYVVDAEPGAGIYFGFKNKITKQEMRRRIGDDTITDVLKRVPAKKGDCFFIPAGTVHAIGAGMLIAEIQQNSNTTYRVYDYGRLGADGKPRELSVEKALDVAFTAPAQNILYDNPDTLACCDYFTANLLKVNGNTVLYPSKESFTALLAVSGTGEISDGRGKISFRAGDCFFIPAGNETVKLTGDAQMITVTV